jgi:hypothetical protein
MSSMWPVCFEEWTCFDEKNLYWTVLVRMDGILFHEILSLSWKGLLRRSHKHFLRLV